MKLGPTHLRALGLLWTCAGCRELPEIPRDVCGNGVIEQGEDCDTFSGSNARCRGPSEPHACHYDCAKDEAGGSANCPDGYACDPEGLCRALTNQFEEVAGPDVGDVRSLSAGDFDGDGRADLLSQTTLDLFGRAPLQAFYFDAYGALSTTRSFPKPVVPPVVAQLTSDARADLTFSAHPGAAHLQANSFRLGVLLGREDRSWIPEAFGSYRIPMAHMRMVGVYDGLIGLDSSTSALAVLTSLGAESGVYVPTDGSRTLDRVAPLEGPAEQLIGNPQTGDLFAAAGSPCRELVLALRGAQTFSVVDLCERRERDTIVFRRPSKLMRIALEPPADIDAAPSIADLNADGHLDVVLGAGARAYVAYGDGQQLSTAVPFDLPSAYPLADQTLASPLAVGDVTADGFPDFVFSTHLLLSHDVPDSELPAYEPTYTNPGQPWTVARIADLNANGHPDVIVASDAAADISVYSGTGGRYMIPGPIQTEGAVLYLETGDFDGDLITDLAFVQDASAARAEQELGIAFGRSDKFPDAPLTTAQVRDTEQLSVYQEGGLSHLMLSSWDSAGDSGMLTLMYGTPDRIPFAPHTLVSFLVDGDTGGSSAVSVLPGKFVTHDADDSGDVMAIGARGNGGAYSFWLVEDIATRQTIPRPLQEAVPEGFAAAIESATGTLRPNVARHAADFDQDGLDEALWLVPSTDLSDCGLFLYDVETDGMTPRAELTLGRPCIDAQLSSADMDGDGALDITLLTGDGKGRAIHTLWNDGAGHFSLDEQQLVAGGGQPIAAFAVLPKRIGRRATAVVIREQEAQLVSAKADGRAFDAPTRLTTLQRGSGVAVGDFNGDSVTDIAIAAAGDIRVFIAQLEGL